MEWVTTKSNSDAFPMKKADSAMTLSILSEREVLIAPPAPEQKVNARTTPGSTEVVIKEQ